MLGYKASMSSERRREHHAFLRNKFPKLHDELHHARSWVDNGNFLDALTTRAPNQLEFCKISMEHAPTRLLDKLIETSTAPNVDLAPRALQTTRPSKPTCHLCGETLAESIADVIDFSLLKCSCGNKYAHTHCAEKHLSNQSQCVACKKSYMLNNIKHSTLRQTLLRF